MVFNDYYGPKAGLPNFLYAVPFYYLSAHSNTRGQRTGEDNY